MQTIDRKQLLHDLESVKKGLSSKDLIEQSTSFIFTDGKVVAFNDDIFAMKKIDLDIEGVVEADALLKLLHKAKDKEIKIEFNENEMRIKGKKFSAGLKFDPEIRIPIDEVNIPKEYNFVEAHPDFAQLAKRACLTAGRSLSEPLLTCVHLHDNIIESCDNDRITVCRLYNNRNNLKDVLVPATSLLEISKENITHLFIDDSWAHFKIDDGTMLSTRLYNEEYVDLEEFLPEEDEFEFIDLPDGLSEILDRASIFSKDKFSMENIVDVEIKNKKLMIKAGSESKWFSEKAVIKTDSNFSFSINADFFKEVINTTNKVAIIEDNLYFDLENSVHLIGLESKEDK